MALDPRLILAGSQPQRPLQSLLQGAQTGQQLVGEQQRQTILGQQAERKAGLAPIQQQEAELQLDQAQQQAALRGMVDLASQASTLPIENQAQFVRSNADRLGPLAGEIANATDQEIIEQIPRLIGLGKQRGLLGSKETKTASQKDFETFERLKSEDPDRAEIFGRQAGFIRPTEQKKADIKVDETIRKEVAKATVARKQGFIDSGIEAADSTANIRRSIKLLEDVKTGGFDQFALRAKQVFGVEGADEGELSANLGRSVLAQLKPIFGAAFTAAEGERLERIEAGFGRSVESNKRLLNNALKIAERAARRGLAAAEELDEEFTANEIRSALKFELSPEDEQAAQQTEQKNFYIFWWNSIYGGINANKSDSAR